MTSHCRPQPAGPVGHRVTGAGSVPILSHRGSPAPPGAGHRGAAWLGPTQGQCWALTGPGAAKSILPSLRPLSPRPWGASSAPKPSVAGETPVPEPSKTGKHHGASCPPGFQASIPCYVQRRCSLGTPPAQGTGTGSSPPVPAMGTSLLGHLPVWAARRHFLGLGQRPGSSPLPTSADAMGYFLGALPPSPILAPQGELPDEGLSPPGRKTQALSPEPVLGLSTQGLWPSPGKQLRHDQVHGQS